ncbi:MAG: glycerate kinase, partial [Lachnospiraceae bacterium]|nr:glycerate kinase [Lachnospiraceae bacterium]
MIRFLILCMILAGFLIFGYPLLIMQNSLGKKDPTARGHESTKIVRFMFSLFLKVAGVKVTVKGPRLTPVEATYSIIEESQTAVIEMAAASGITLIPPHLRNPLETTTYGVGEMMIDALERGCRKLIIGIGGSATNDGGVGMLTALGYAFLDKEGHPIPLGGKGLEHLCSISAEGVHPAL